MEFDDEGAFDVLQNDAFIDEVAFILVSADFVLI